MLDSSKRTIATLTAAACLGAGGWAMAATTSGASTAATSSTAAQTQTAQQAPAQGQYGPPPGAPNGQGPGPGSSFPGEKLLTGSDADKATAAAKAKLPGATIVRVETDANDGGAYEAHVTKSDGSPAIVIMDKNFTVTQVVDH